MTSQYPNLWGMKQKVMWTQNTILSIPCSNHSERCRHIYEKVQTLKIRHSSIIQWHFIPVSNWQKQKIECFKTNSVILTDQTPLGLSGLQDCFERNGLPMFASPHNSISQRHPPKASSIACKQRVCSSEIQILSETKQGKCIGQAGGWNKCTISSFQRSKPELVFM